MIGSVQLRFVALWFHPAGFEGSEALLHIRLWCLHRLLRCGVGLGCLRRLLCLGFVLLRSHRVADFAEHITNDTAERETILI